MKRRNIILIVFFVAIIVIIIAISIFRHNNFKKFHFVGEIQGTYFSVIYYDAENRDFEHEIDSVLKNFDQIASLWEDNSEISRCNRNENFKLSPIFEDLFNKSQEISAMSDGAFDITVGNLVKMYGFWRNNQEEISEEKISNLLQLVGYQKVKIIDRQLVKDDDSIKIDFNAIAQGYSVDVLCDFLAAQGLKNYLVDIGGEIRSSGKKVIENSDWIVGIERPAENSEDEQHVQMKIALQDKSVVTSGSYRKYFEKEGQRYSHTIDPKTGRPIEHNLLSVSVIDLYAWRADALATVFMVLGKEESLTWLSKQPKLQNVEVIFISSDGDGGFEVESKMNNE
jgi:thiamine biosynthesis lipoprotein